MRLKQSIILSRMYIQLLLDKITDDKSLEIDTKHLRKQGAALRVRLEKIIQSLRSQQQQPQETGAQDADRIRDGVMYG
jgi:hypothetical protein